MHGTTTIQGSNPFKIPATDFILSPLSADAVLKIRSIVNNVINEKEIAQIKAGEYTKVTGSVPYIEYVVITEDTFYIKW